MGFVLCILGICLAAYFVWMTVRIVNSTQPKEKCIELARGYATVLALSLAGVFSLTLIGALFRFAWQLATSP